MKGLFAIFLSVSQAWAAPMPATSSSLVISVKPGVFRSPRGFSLNAAHTEWVLGDAPSSIPSVVTIYRSPESNRGVQPVLTVRVDQLRQKQDLKSYVKQWMKDYSILGLSVLKAGPLKVNSQSAFLVDLDETKGEKRLRQIVFLKDQTAVVLTCRDRRETFSKTVRSCNEIFKSFEWSSSPEAASRQTGV